MKSLPISKAVSLSKILLGVFCGCIALATTPPADAKVRVHGNSVHFSSRPATKPATRPSNRNYQRPMYNRSTSEAANNQTSVHTLQMHKRSLANSRVRTVQYTQQAAPKQSASLQAKQPLIIGWVSPIVASEMGYNQVPIFVPSKPLPQWNPIEKTPELSPQFFVPLNIPLKSGVNAFITLPFRPDFDAK